LRYVHHGLLKEKDRLPGGETVLRAAVDCEMGSSPEPWLSVRLQAAEPHLAS